MQTKVIKLDAANPDSAKIKEAAATLDTGGLVAFPTETVYGIACLLETNPLRRLDKLKGRHPDKHYTLHIGRKTDVEKYLPVIGLRAQKLIQNAWPGPLTIVFELDTRAVEKQRKCLDKHISEILYKDNSIGIRCPDNPVAALLLQSAKKSPVVAPSANITGQPPATNADHVLAQLAGKIDLLLDAGPCKYKKSSTVVKIGKKGLQILRPGIYSLSQLEAMSEIKFLFVCSGNTCRSPMAQGMFAKNLAKKLQCPVDHLNKTGYKILSAGTMRIADMPASQGSIAACAARGVDIKAHKSTALSQHMVEESDFIFAMTRSHCEQIVALDPKSRSKCVLLAEEQDIVDPVGQSQQVYDNCAELIERAVEKRLRELVV